MTRGIVGIYIIRNKENGKAYVGQSVDVEHRAYSHFSRLRWGRHENRFIQHDYSENPDAFTWELICRCTEAELDDLEKKYIALLRTTDPGYGYNLQRGGQTRHRMTAEEKQRLSEAASGKKFSAEHRRRIGEANSRRIVTEETRKKIGAIKSRPVIQMDMDGVFIARHKSIKSASEAVGLSSPRSISRVLSGKYNQSAGYKWCYG